MDIQATLKAKIDLDRAPYVILGACNPPLAAKALSVMPEVGVFLPCNVTIYKGEDGKMNINAMNPYVMHDLPPFNEKNDKTAVLQEVAEEAYTKINLALDEGVAMLK